MANLLPEGRPALPYLQPSNCVPCPRFNNENMEEMQDETNTARSMFEHLCPPAAKILDISGIKYHEEHKCMWIVRYCQNINMEPLTRREMLRQLRKAHPRNTKISREISIYYPSELEIHYSLHSCNCSSVRFRYRFRAEADSYINYSELNSNFCNIRIEENSQ